MEFAPRNPEKAEPTWSGVRLWRAVRPAIFGVALIAILALIMISDLLPSQQMTLEVGDVAPEEVLAPRSTSYISQVLTDRARQEAIANVRDVYDRPDMRVARAQVSYAHRVLDFLETVRSDPLAGKSRQRAYSRAVPQLGLDADTADALLNLSGKEWESVRQDTVTVVDQAMREEIRPDRLQEAQARVALLVRLELPEKEATSITALAQRLIVPNSSFNAQLTLQSRQQAAASVESVRQSFDLNSAIVHQGEEVDEADLEAMQHFGLLQSKDGWEDSLRLALAVALIVTLLALYVQRFYPRFLVSSRHLALLSLLLILFALTAKLVVPGRAVLPFLFPAAALAMLLTALFDSNLAIAATVCLGALVGLIGGNSLELVMYVSMGGITAALMVRRSPRISTFFRAGVIVAVVNIGVVLVYRINSSDLLGILQLAGASLLNGLFSAGITLVGFFVIGNVFHVVTFFQLQELARLDHPLLQELLRQAPGTYHHSLMVANLAEQAARRIGADADLVRVGSFYHDVGKTARPYFFTENQTDSDAHTRLDPLTSAQIITRHVQDGMDLARRYHLPEKIRAFISEHQGTRVVKSFYHQALKAAQDPEQIKIDDFRYPGPNPQTPETAVVLLADSCEAASTALQTRTEQEIERLVEDVVNRALMDGELDESGLTIGDLRRIKASFVETLHGRFHSRVKYPGQRTSDLLRSPRAATREPAGVPESSVQEMAREKAPGPSHD